MDLVPNAGRRLSHLLTLSAVASSLKLHQSSFLAMIELVCSCFRAFAMPLSEMRSPGSLQPPWHSRFTFLCSISRPQYRGLPCIEYICSICGLAACLSPKATTCLLCHQTPRTEPGTLETHVRYLQNEHFLKELALMLFFGHQKDMV